MTWIERKDDRVVRDYYTKQARFSNGLYLVRDLPFFHSRFDAWESRYHTTGEVLPNVETIVPRQLREYSNRSFFSRI